MLGSIVVDGTSADLPCAHLVYAATPYTDSTLVWPDGRTTRTGYQLNALAADGPRMHALAIRRGGAAFGDGAHLVTIEADGTTRDRGTVGPRFDESYAGAMVAGRYHVAAEGRMYVLDPDTATVLASAPMDVTATVGDWEYDPADGGLYGVTAEGHAPALLLRTDPGTGNTRTVGKLPESAYGSAFLGPGRTLYTLANNDAGRSSWYAVPLARPADTAKLGAGPQAATSDATGCAPRAAPGTPAATPRPSPSRRVAPPPVAVAAPVPPSATPPARKSPLPPPPPLPFEPVAAPIAHTPVESWTTRHWIAFMVFAFGATGVGARRMRAK
ncbi:hypothetical protein AB0M43_23045 [Longispora sp. NPDC051575]|uniref:DUF6923 family protein n=1 Tax=Longispora sp. NPDC051575 TaxID=3154943 RepID=UPI003439EC97